MAVHTRDELRSLIDALPDEHVPAVLAFARLVQSGRVNVHLAPSTGDSDDAGGDESLFSEEELADDPMLHVLAVAPEDDEPLSDDDAASIAEGLAEYRRGDYVSGSLAKRAPLK